MAHGNLEQELRALQERLRHIENAKRNLARELSERAQSEASLNECIERVLEALDSAEVGLWSLNLATQRVWYSREWKRQLGYQEHEVTDALDEWSDRVHPEDLKLVSERASAYLGNPKGVHEVEFRMRHRDGYWRWIFARGQIIRDQAGNAVYFAGGHFDITDRRAVREQVLKEREHSEQIVNSLPGVFYLFDQHGRYLRWNKNLEILTGYSPEEIEALHPLDLFHGAHRELMSARIQEVFDNGQANAEADLITKDGSAHAYYLTGKLIQFDGAPCLIGMGIDIEERKRAEVALQVSEQRYAQLVNDVEGIVWEADPDTFQFTFVSDFAETLSGYSIMQWYEPDFWVDHLHPDDRAKALSVCLEQTENGEAHDLEYRMIASDGRILWLRDLISVERIEGKPCRLRGIIVDVTEHKLAEQARNELEARLRQSQKMEALGTFAGGMAHDFNNILATIIGNAHIARDELRHGSRPLDTIEEILRAGQRAKEVVQRILTFSRPQEQRLQALNIAPAVEEAVTLLRTTLPAAVNIVFSSQAELPNVRADPSQIHQIVLNLATNAWHALEHGSGRIDVRVDRLTVTSAQITLMPELQPGEYVRLSVHDTGKGIDKASLPRIFEPFFTTKPHGQGTGLGLSVVHGIVRNHHGAIRVDSELGLGATFCVYFPVTSEAAHELPPGTPEMSYRGNGEHILYVDDDEPLVFLTKRFLERHGYRVTGHTSVDDALREFRSDPKAFDVVITDSNMPGTSGLDLAESLLEIYPTADIVLTSRYLTPEDVARASEIGVRDVILKPNTVEELVPLVQRLLRHGEQKG